MSTIVVLNGTSSSGKTSVALAFQERAPRTFLNFSIDSILYTLPPTAIQRIIKGDDISDLRYSELVRAFYVCVRQLADLGHDLVIDHAITSRDQAELLLSALSGHSAVLVALECSEVVLAEREALRGDRRVGLAARQLPLVHRWLSYDLSIRTDSTSVEEAARTIVAALETQDRTGVEETRSRLTGT